MAIVLMEKRRGIAFSELKKGKLFTDGGIPYMKTNERDIVNAVRLSDGELDYFNDDREVIPIDFRDLEEVP